MENCLFAGPLADPTHILVTLSIIGHMQNWDITRTLSTTAIPFFTSTPMSAVRTIRQFPPSLFQEEKVGEIVIQPGDRTPQIMQGVEATQLSSPIQRYEIREESQSPKIIFKHKASDRVRLKVSSMFRI